MISIYYIVFKNNIRGFSRDDCLNLTFLMQTESFLIKQKRFTFLIKSGSLTFKLSFCLEWWQRCLKNLFYKYSKSLNTRNFKLCACPLLISQRQTNFQFSTPQCEIGIPNNNFLNFYIRLLESVKNWNFRVTI